MSKLEPAPAPGPRRAAAALAVATLAALATTAGCGGSAAGPDQATPPAGCASPADCDDGNACTAETCTAGACGGTYLDLTAGVLLGAGLAGADGATLAVTTTTGSVIPRTTHTFCPDGPDPASDPPACVGEVDLPAATGARFTPSPGGEGGTIVATLPVRFPMLVTEVSQTAGVIGSGSIAVVGNGACPGAVQTSASLPVRVAFAIDDAGALDAVASVDAVALANATVECLTGSVASQVRALIAEAGRSLLRARLQVALELALERQLCAAPPCPSGYGEAGGLCRKGGLAGAPCLARPLDPRTRLLEPAACVP